MLPRRPVFLLWCIPPGIGQTLQMLPGDLSDDFIRTWALQHVSKDIQRLANDDCPVWPEDVPHRPRTRDEMEKVLVQLERQPCVLRSVWLAGYLCVIWERVLERYEDALVMGGGQWRREEAEIALSEIQDALTTPAISAGVEFFRNMYGDLTLHRTRLDALELARVISEHGLPSIRNADPISHVVATKRAKTNMETVRTGERE
jgi:hypothetical protein